MYSTMHYTVHSSISIETADCVHGSVKDGSTYVKYSAFTWYTHQYPLKQLIAIAAVSKMEEAMDCEMTTNVETIGGYRPGPAIFTHGK